jgi:hypothetical protein
MVLRRKGKDSQDTIYDFEKEEELEAERKRQEQLERESLKAQERDKKKLAEIQRLEDERRAAAEAQKKRDAEIAAIEDRKRQVQEKRRLAQLQNVENALAQQATSQSTATEDEIPLSPGVTSADVHGVVGASKPIDTPAGVVPQENDRTVVPISNLGHSEIVELIETTENVISPIIGSGPSQFFKTPWWDTKRSLRGLSFDGYASDVHCDSGTFGNIASIGATFRGLKHQVPDRQSGVSGQNEDWFSTVCAHSQTGAKFVVSVVCDGLSSAKYSWFGARKVSTVLSRDIATAISTMDHVDASTLQTFVDRSLQELAQNLLSWSPNEFGAPKVDPSEVDPNALGCTVTLLVVEADSPVDVEHRVIAGNVGDSPVLHLSNGSWRKVSPIDSDSGDILETKTSAFPRHLNCALVNDVLRQGECLVATSDGVGNFVYRNGMTLALGQYLSTRWSSPVGIMSFLNHMNFDLPTADDDRTAVAMWIV